MAEPLVYDLLEELDGEGLKQAINLIVLAGQLGLGGGYFFEKKSFDVLEELAQVEIFDADNNSLGTIPNSGWFFEKVLLAKDPRFTFGKSYRMGEPKVTKQVLDKLYKVQDVLLKSLRHRGIDAVREYRLVSEFMGGVQLTDDEVRATIKKALS